MYYIFSDSGNVSLEYLLTVFNGAGGFSYTDMTYIKLSDTQDWHFPWRHLISDYNAVVASAGLSLMEKLSPFSHGSNIKLFRYDIESILSDMNGSKEALLEHVSKLEYQIRYKCTLILN